MLPQHSCCADILPALAKKCLYTAFVMLLAPMASGWTAGRAVRTSRIPLRKALQVQPGQRWSFLGGKIRSAPTLYAGANAGRALEASALSRSETSREQLPAETRPTTSQEVIQGPVPAFEFHSGFWINLHHFLYQQARLRKSTPQSIPRPAPKVEGSGAKEPATSANSLGPTPGSGQAPTEALTEEGSDARAVAPAGGPSTTERTAPELRRSPCNSVRRAAGWRSSSRPSTRQIGRQGGCAWM